MSEHVVVLSTVGKAEDATRIARALVERRLAACVNVLPGVRSFYLAHYDMDRSTPASRDTFIEQVRTRVSGL